MGRIGAITALAGVASGVLFLSLVMGATAAPLLAYFVQLPILFCGLAFGLGPAAIAAVGAAAMSLGAGSLLAPVLFLGLEAAPALLLVRQVGHHASRAAHGSEPRRFHGGRVMTDLAAAGALAALLGLLWLGAGQAQVAELVTGMVDAGATQGGQAAMMPVQALLVSWASWLPGIAVASWLSMVLVNGVLAQALVNRAGFGRREFGKLADLQLPAWWALVAAVALGAIIIGGDQLGLLGRTLLVVAAIPFLFLGLAVVHAFARRRALGRLPLLGFYMLLVVFSWPLLLFVIGLGMIEDVVGVRRRFAW